MSIREPEMLRNDSSVRRKKLVPVAAHGASIHTTSFDSVDHHVPNGDTTLKGFTKAIDA
jgi:hypothetical protein